MYITIRMTNSKKITGRLYNLIFFKDDMPTVEDGKIAQIPSAPSTVIYNGAERVIVTQLVRSPGPYFSAETDKYKSNIKLYSSQIIPNRLSPPARNTPAIRVVFTAAPIT